MGVINNGIDIKIAECRKIRSPSICQLLEFSPTDNLQKLQPRLSFENHPKFPLEILGCWYKTLPKNFYLTNIRFN